MTLASRALRPDRIYPSPSGFRSVLLDLRSEASTEEGT